MLVGYATHIGRVRDKNEDALFVGENVYAVADGMGGHNAGEVASRIAVDSVEKLMRESKLPMPQRIEKCFKQANTKILKEAFEEKSGMGTTLTMAAIVEESIIIGHVGDSRAYLISDGDIKRITVDHSVVGELVRSGFISEEDAKIHPQRNTIIRSLGDMAQVKVDINEVPVKAGDSLILCTDGLHNKMDDDEIKEIVLAHEDPQSVVDELVNLANIRGGHDNITAIVVMF